MRARDRRDNGVVPGRPVLTGLVRCADSATTGSLVVMARLTVSAARGQYPKDGHLAAESPSSGWWRPGRLTPRTPPLRPTHSRPRHHPTPPPPPDTPPPINT